MPSSGFLMIVIAALFLLYIWAVHWYILQKVVLGKLFHRRAAGIEGIQVKSLPLSAKHIADDTLFYRNRKLTLDCRIACRGYA